MRYWVTLNMRFAALNYQRISCYRQVPGTTVVHKNCYKLSMVALTILGKCEWRSYQPIAPLTPTHNSLSTQTRSHSSFLNCGFLVSVSARSKWYRHLSTILVGIPQKYLMSVMQYMFLRYLFLTGTCNLKLLNINISQYFMSWPSTTVVATGRLQ